MEASAMHIYHSALPWSPTSSLTRESHQGQLSAEAKLVNATDVTWDAYIRTIPMYDRVHRLELSPKGTLIAALGLKHTKNFSAVTGTCLATFDGQHSVLTVAFSLDDNLLACGLRHGTVIVLDVQTDDIIQTFQGHKATVWSVAFSPCGTMIASGASDKTIRIWNMISGRCECCLEGHSDTVWVVCWSAKRNQVISGSYDTTVRIWDVLKQKCLVIIRGHTKMVTSIASCRDLVASGSGDGMAIICDSGSGNVLQTIKICERIDTVQFSSHGDNMMCTCGDLASIWDLGRKMRVLTTRLDGYRARFAPDGTYVASLSDKFVKIWKPTIDIQVPKQLIIILAKY
jgi:WD40 repeat protein